MQSIVISNLRATSRLAITGGAAAVRTKSDNLLTKRDVAESKSPDHNNSNGDNYHSNKLRYTKAPEYSATPTRVRTARIDSNSLTEDQRKLAQLPTHKIKAMIQYDILTPECINLILRFIAAKQMPDQLLGFVEEKALSYLTLEDDDLIAKYLRRRPDFDYDSICALLMGLASNHRRPTPLLKAAAAHLCKLAPEKRADFSLIAGALSALVSLNYPNKPLIARLMDDLAITLNFDRFGPKAICNLLRIMRSLRWRSDRLLDGIIHHLSSNMSQPEPNVMATLVHVLAYLDYPVDGVLQQLQRSFMSEGKEEVLKKDRKTWLTYVWSLVALKLADKSHLESVLNDEFSRCLIDRAIDQPLSYSDAMKLLNLHALAKKEYKLDELDRNSIENLVQYKIHRSADNKRFHQRIETVIQGIIGSKEKMLTNVETPYGFTIDFELAFDSNYQLLPIDVSRTLDENAHHNGSRHLAVILVPYEDTLANLQAEPVGYKKMVARIFRSFGYQTVYFSEVILNREKTSTDLTGKVKELLALPGDSVPE